MDYIAIGRKIKMYRKKLNITQAQLAENLDVTAKYISSIERGASSLSLNRLEDIAKALKVKPEQLISDSDLTSPDYAVSEYLTLTENWTVREKEFLIVLIEAMDKFFHN